MGAFIHSILRTNNAIAADGDVVYDLPVNPLSVILLHVSPLNESSTITTYSLLEGLLAALVNVRVDHKGAAVVNLSGADLAALCVLWHGLPLWQSGAMETDNFRRSLVLPILFGRRPYMKTECFPETKKGELQLSCTWDIAATAFDGLRISIETIELPDAAPEFVQKATTLAQTFGATGQQDVDLPIGNVLRALMLWGTTGYTGATPAPTWGQVSVLRDNKQLLYSASDWEVARGIHGLLGRPFPMSGRHIHSLNAAGAGLEDTLEPEIGASLDDNYLLLPFDVTADDEYSLETAGAGRVQVRATAEAAEAVRVVPIERVPAAQYLE